MTVNQLISDEVPPVKTTDSAEKALRWMDQFKVAWLPVVYGSQFVGMISESELYELEETESPIGAMQLALMKPQLLHTQHAYDAMKLMAQLNVDVIGVSDEKGRYLGAITLRGLTAHLSQMAAVREPGGIIVLEVNNVDYSMSQIAQIVEGNDAKILSVYVAGIPGTPKVEVTVKTNREDLSRILQTFERYSYTVKATYHQSLHEEDMRRRFDEFMNFINI